MNREGKKCILYPRVSTEMQVEGYSLDGQKTSLKKFAEREKRRGKTYDGIIMDPPSYGRGPNGELWKLEDNADELISLAASLLSEKPLFFLINSYTTGLSPASMGYMLVSSLSPELKKKAAVETGEIGLPVKASGMPLPAGASARCTF